MTNAAAPLGRFGIAIETLGVERAWNRTRGSPSVVVGIVDEGVQLDHPLLAPNIKKDHSHTAVASGEQEVAGTWIAGIVAGRASEDGGFSGLAPLAKILPVPVSAGSGPQALDLAQAIEYAVEMGASIVNVSRPESAPMPALARAIQYAAARNALVVCPCSEAWSEIQAREGDESLPNVITTLAFDERHASLTDCPPHGAHLAAPGFARVPKWRGENHEDAQNEVFGAAYVSGCAALVKSLNPGWGYHEIKEHLLTSAVKDSSLAERCRGGARLDVANAVLGPIELTMGTEPLVWSSLNDALVKWRMNYPSAFCVNASALYRRHGDEHWRELGFARASVGKMVVSAAALRRSSGILRVASREANFSSDEIAVTIR